MKERPRPLDAPARRPFFGWASPNDAALLTDLYEITMLQAYWRRGMTEGATFDLFVRSLPAVRRFLVVAGIEPARRASQNRALVYDPKRDLLLLVLGRRGCRHRTGLRHALSPRPGQVHGALTPSAGGASGVRAPGFQPGFSVQGSRCCG